MPQNETTSEQWIKSASDTYPKVALSKTFKMCEIYCKQSGIVALHDIKDTTGKMI